MPDSNWCKFGGLKIAHHTRTPEDLPILLLCACSRLYRGLASTSEVGDEGYERMEVERTSRPGGAADDGNIGVAGKEVRVGDPCLAEFFFVELVAGPLEICSTLPSPLGVY